VRPVVLNNVEFGEGDGMSLPQNISKISENLLQNFYKKIPSASVNSPREECRMKRLRPCLDDIYFKHRMEYEIEMACLSAESERILRRLVVLSATLRVWTYSEPTDGGIGFDEQSLIRICRTTKHLWGKHSAAALAFFELKNGKYYLSHDWVKIVGGNK